MRRIVFLFSSLLVLFACTHNQSLSDTPIEQSWILGHLEGYDDFYNDIKLADGDEWVEEQAISDNRLTALYYPKKNLVIGQSFSGCNGAVNYASEDNINNWQTTFAQVSCPRIYKLADGSYRENSLGSRNIADLVFSKIAPKISRQSVDLDAGLLTWYSVDNQLLATFKLEAAQS